MTMRAGNPPGFSPGSAVLDEGSGNVLAAPDGAKVGAAVCDPTDVAVWTPDGAPVCMPVRAAAASPVGAMVVLPVAAGAAAEMDSVCARAATNALADGNERAGSKACRMTSFPASDSAARGDNRCCAPACAMSAKGSVVPPSNS